MSSLKATKLSETCKHVQDLPCTGKDEKTQSNKRSHWQSWGSQNFRLYPSHGQGSSEGTRSNLPHQSEIRHVELHSTSWDQSAIILGSHLACDGKTADMVHKKKAMYNGNHYPSETMCTYFNVHISMYIFQTLNRSWCHGAMSYYKTYVESGWAVET